MLRLSAVGDVCHTVPVLRALQDRWPETKITWIIGRLEASLIGDIPGVEFIIFDKKSGLAGYRALGRALGGRRFDLLLHMQVALRASMASVMIRADRRIGFDRSRARDWQWLFTSESIAERPRQHVMEGLLEFARLLGAEASTPRWDIPLPDADRDFALTRIPTTGGTLIVSPCSSQRTRNFRNWRPERYAAVIDPAAETHGLDTLITGGPTRLERDYADAILTACRHRPRSLVGETSLKQLLALLGRARAIVCPDSGPAHMATAAGCPVIGLYASSNPGRTGPYFSREWTVDRYAEALQAETGKTVDEVRWGTRVRDPRVMDRIAVEDVTAKLDALMDESPATH
jgi:heptosyltransferase I